MKISKNLKTDRIGVQIVGEQFERAGYIFREQAISDYGIDAQVELVEGDNVTGKLIAIQIKSGSSWFQEEIDGNYIFRGDRGHLNYWLDHSLPVIIVLCDTKTRQCYWQSISAPNVLYTLKAWKISVPKYQTINPGMDVDLKRLVNRLIVYNNYTIGSINDVSHGAAKRYLLRVILNREHTQAEIIGLVKSATAEAVNCEYHRSDITRRHWRNQPAHVVWLNIYPSAEDEQNNNFICQSEWFSEHLQAEFLPLSNGGEEICPNIKVSWNNDYLTTAMFNSKHTITKEEFLLKVNNLAEMIKPLLIIACDAVKSYKSGQLDFHDLQVTLGKEYREIDDIYRQSNDVGLSPYECKDISTKFESLVAHAHNVYLPFSGIGKEFDEDQVIFNINSQSKYYYEAVEEFSFELNKVQ